jgi:hypothetical protein
VFCILHFITKTPVIPVLIGGKFQSKTARTFDSSLHHFLLTTTPHTSLISQQEQEEKEEGGDLTHNNFSLFLTLLDLSLP